ncbi:hypothetical protein DBR11_27255 [Pedobacter sp. HMWF019]|uniref:DUF6266 family protein n=1 Tax=Pedobacter sp. HMWF019 TaxID=2056856 RepID=UPI000D39B07D|nr:DUF6266 family protein [Pedobacter sp. HMWF019]PTS92281.1 hypothetical protein DBR11_27255 [Pedobacter sp. HMWF019]
MTLSRGALITSWVLEVLLHRDHILYLKWDNPPETKYCDPEDRMNLIFYSSDKEQYLTFENTAERSAREVTLQMNKNFAGGTVNGWMHYVNKEGTLVSTSVYLGQNIF